MLIKDGTLIFRRFSLDLPLNPIVRANDKHGYLNPYPLPSPHVNEFII